MEDIIKYFTQQGTLGVVIAMLVYVVIWQQKRIDSKDNQITDLQDKRKLDTDNYTQSYTAIIKESITMQKDNLNSNNLMRNSLDNLIQIVQTFINGNHS